jgi:hypothetical protein
MDDMENERQKVDTTFTTSGIPPASLYEQKQAIRLLGFLRSRDGVGEVTSEAQSLRNRSNAG